MWIYGIYIPWWSIAGVAICFIVAIAFKNWYAIAGLCFGVVLAGIRMILKHRRKVS